MLKIKQDFHNRKIRSTGPNTYSIKSSLTEIKFYFCAYY